MVKRMMVAHRLLRGWVGALMTVSAGCHQLGKYQVLEETQGAVLPSTDPSTSIGRTEDGSADASVPPLESQSDAALATDWPSRSEAISDGGPSSHPNPNALTQADFDSSAMDSPRAVADGCNAAGQTDGGCAMAQDCGWARTVIGDERPSCVPGGRFRQVGTRADDNSTSITFAPDGSVWLAGETAGKFPGQISKGWDAFIAGWAPDGTTSWTRQVIGDEGLEYPAIVATTRGSLVLAATDIRFDAPRGILIKAFDLGGSELWAQHVDGEFDVEVGGIVAAPEGGVYVSGWKAVGNINDAGERPGMDILTFFNDEGEWVWTSELPAIELDEPSTAVLSRALTAWPDGSVLVSASLYTDMSSFPFGGRVALTKLSPTGEVTWQKVLDAEGELTNQIAIDGEGNVVFGSASAFEGVVHKLSPDGEPIWSVGVGPITYRFPKVATDPAGNVYAVVTTDSSHSDLGYDGFESHYGSMDIAVSLLSAAGDVIWTKQFGTPEDDVAAGVAWSAGSVYIYGETHGDFGGVQGGVDAFVVQVAQ